MNLPSFAVFSSFVLWGLTSLVVSQTDDSCNSNLRLNNVPFDTATLNCLQAWNTHNYVLRYKQTSTNVWSFVLSAPEANSYVAIGFSQNGNMVGSSAMVGWVGDNGTAFINQYHLTGKTPGQVIPGQGDLTINSSTTISQASRIYLAFQLTIDQPSSYVLYSIGRAGSLPSEPSYTLTEHRDKVSTTLNYITGQTNTQNKPYTRLRRTHGILNMISWGSLIIIGAIVARYFKHSDPIWFYIHVAVQLSAFTLGVIGIICGFVLEDKLNADVSTHKALGIFILVLGCLQVMAILARPEVSSKLRKYWNWYHYTLGRTAIGFAIGNVFYGISLGGEGGGWNAGYGVTIGLLFVVAATLEIRLWRKMSR